MNGIEPHWLWLLGAAALGIAELLFPGIFLIWIAAAAAGTGLLTLVTGIGVAFQFALFALLLLQTDHVKTLTVGVLQLQSRFVTDYPALMAGLLITSLPVIGAYLIFQRHLVRGIIAGTVKGGSKART